MSTANCRRCLPTHDFVDSVHLSFASPRIAFPHVSFESSALVVLGFSTEAGLLLIEETEEIANLEILETELHIQFACDIREFSLFNRLIQTDQNRFAINCPCTTTTLDHSTFGTNRVILDDKIARADIQALFCHRSNDQNLRVSWNQSI